MPINIKEFLAKQLNDHSESPSGVVQQTYYEWGEQHLEDAISLALCYVYSIIPREFTDIRSHVVNAPDCVVELCDFCDKFMGLIAVSDGDGDCLDVKQSEYKPDDVSNSILDLLALECPIGEEGIVEPEWYTYEIVKGTTCVLKFNHSLPVGSTIRYSCASPPSDIDNISETLLCEYGGLIADYSLWWLFRTDSESRSNLVRAQLHFDAVKDFVTTKLLLEFSLTEDDYELARRKVDD